MDIDIRWGEVEKSDALEGHVRHELDHAMRHYKTKIMHVHAHMHDDNASKNGPDDKRCVVHAKPAGADAIVIECAGDDHYKNISQAAKKLESAVRHFIDKRRDH